MAHWIWTCICLASISKIFNDQNHLAKQAQCLLSVFDIAALIENAQSLFIVQLCRFAQLGMLGQWTDAESMWKRLDPMGRMWTRSVYRPGDAEYEYTVFRFQRRTLKERHLTQAEELAKVGKNRRIIRLLHSLRGVWQSEQGQWRLAAESLQEAVRMAREVGEIDAASETQLALAKFHLNELSEPRQEATQLAKAKNPSHLDLAELWFAIGDREEAKQHSLAAYQWAWSDGEPYVRRYELNKSRALLEQLGAEIPNLLPYDPAKDEQLP